MISYDPKPSYDTSGSLLADTLLDDFSCGIVVFDEEKKITTLNSTAAHLLGLKSEKSPPAFTTLPPALQELVSASLAGHQTFEGHQIVLPAPPGVHSIRAHSVAVRSARGEVAGAVVAMQDMADAETLEENVRRLHRLASIGSLSASMAHEIKNALVPIKTFVELLLEKNQDSELGGIVRREMYRIDAIVSQMLKFGGRAKPAFAVTSVHETLEHALRLVQHELDGKQILLRRSFNATPDLVRGDAYQLEQAFINIFLNSLEAMRPHGELTVATEIVSPLGSERRLRVQIRDTGIGIAPANLSQLFEPFFTTKKEGTGLGLAITRRIIQEHSGSISVESEPDKGATFSIHFPLLAEDN